MPSLPGKMKKFLILAKNFRKITIKPLPQCTPPPPTRKPEPAPNTPRPIAAPITL